MDRNKKTAVFGIYPSLEAANNATDVLVKGGFPSSEISALLPDNLGSRPIATEKSTKAPEGAAAGGGSGAGVGGVAGALIGLGIPEYEAKRYESRLNKGGVLLSVHCNTADEIKRAKNLMEGRAAEDISSTGESTVSNSAQTRSAKL